MISIIIPIYNRGYCLARCLDSVLHQTFTNWECILIDDGSTDDTLSVCQQYVEKDTRFHVYSQQNGGVSVARNRGLERALGDFITFIDSDDWVETDYLQKLYESIDDRIMPLCGLQIQSLEGKTYDYAVKNVLYQMDENITDLIVEQWSSGLLAGPVCKLYERSIIEVHKIRFPINTNWGEDLIFNYNYFQYIDKIKGIPFVLYHVIKQTESLSVNVKYDFFISDVNKKLWNSVFTFLQIKGIHNPVIDAYMDFYYTLLFFQQIGGVLHVHDKLSCKQRYKRMKDLVSHADQTRLRNVKTEGLRCKALFVSFKMSFLIFLFYEIKYLFLSLKK